MSIFHVFGYRVCELYQSIQLILTYAHTYTRVKRESGRERDGESGRVRRREVYFSDHCALNHHGGWNSDPTLSQHTFVRLPHNCIRN